MRAHGHYVVRLGVLVALLAGERATAQQEFTHLSPRPPAIAIGTRTPTAAGWQPPDSLTRASVYVPAPCVGTRRCPLVVLLRSAQEGASWSLESQRPFAEQYGMILLVPDTSTGAQHSILALDTVLPRAFQAYAIDPDKVALVIDRGTDRRVEFGCVNLDWFSRLALISPWIHTSQWSDGARVCRAPEPRRTSARVYLSGGMGEEFVSIAMRTSQELRRAGYPADLALALRGYQARPEDHVQLWQWLNASWAASVGAGDTLARSPVADPGPLLTARALEQLITFWTRFQQAPDSIRTTARQAHQQLVVVPVRDDRFTLRMMDTPALAAQYPSVRAALRAARLTARQADAYRRALIVASANMRADWRAERLIAPVPADARFGQNIAFLRAHKERLKVLGATGMWITP